MLDQIKIYETIQDQINRPGPQRWLRAARHDPDDAANQIFCELFDRPTTALARIVNPDAYIGTVVRHAVSKMAKRAFDESKKNRPLNPENFDARHDEDF